MYYRCRPMEDHRPKHIPYVERRADHCAEDRLGGGGVRSVGCDSFPFPAPAEQAQTGKISYGFAKYLRDGLPNASFIGFTGTFIKFLSSAGQAEWTKTGLLPID
jgi:hypothetical protein